MPKRNLALAHVSAASASLRWDYCFCSARQKVQSSSSHAEFRQALVLQAHRQENVAKLFDRKVVQESGCEIDGKAAAEDLELRDEHFAVPAGQDADEFFDLIRRQHRRLQSVALVRLARYRYYADAPLPVCLRTFSNGKYTIRRQAVTQINPARCLCGLHRCDAGEPLPFGAAVAHLPAHPTRAAPARAAGLGSVV